ncbi:LysR substrate-binding domain-containing protein [Pusillimonas sp. SM2304]|uniref:LysR family transcriptional regulator n=1 Tax=Pusillimonas sp. SM2304 TaxID=3073241 RepID=UPI00287422BD|nr:LysR substrate-binding domain-containing protein [Pusillimonas sp. SM2304]MDS1138966.1 LysR substrate-binding domain-containing protein [Pusillimonas sp. SM2304]
MKISKKSMADSTGDNELTYRHLKLRHLRLLQLLETEGSITGAAKAMHLTQSATSAMLKELESIFGIQMVERGARGVVLTKAARVALRRFSIALTEIKSAHDEAVLAQTHKRLRLRVGALTLTMLDLVPQALSILLSRTSDIQVDITEGTVNGLADALLRGELDCVLGRISPTWSKWEEEQTEKMNLFDEPRCLVCRAGHALASRRSAGLATLAAHQWVLPPIQSSTRLAFNELFLAKGLMPPIPVVESQAAHSNMDIVAATHLLGIAPLALARRHIAMGRLHRLAPSVDLTGFPVSMIWRRVNGSDPALVKFREALVLASRSRGKMPSVG